MAWNKESFYNFILKNNVIGFFKEPLKLKSGRLSYWYVNWRNVAEDVFTLDELSDFLIDYVKYLKLDPDCFFGVPEGATKLGIITQYKWARAQGDFVQRKYTLSMGRANPKEHGELKDKYFLGVPKGKVIILEDTVTTGESLIHAVEQLNNINVNIIAAICLTNRNEIRDDGTNISELIDAYGVKLYAMSEGVELLPIAFKKLQPARKVAMEIENYYKKYGVTEIKLL